MHKGELVITITNPHKGDIGVGVLKQILRQAEITENEWEDAK